MPGSSYDDQGLPYQSMHDFLNVVGHAKGVWVDEDFDLDFHNEIYPVLFANRDDEDALEALDYTIMGHTVPEKTVNKLKEKNLWITGTPSDSLTRTSKSTQTETPERSWWSRLISKARFILMGMK